MRDCFKKYVNNCSPFSFFPDFYTYLYSIFLEKFGVAFVVVGVGGRSEGSSGF